MKSYDLWITLESQSLATLILAINIPRLGQQRITEHYQVLEKIEAMLDPIKTGSLLGHADAEMLQLIQHLK